MKRFCIVCIMLSTQFDSNRAYQDWATILDSKTSACRSAAISQTWAFKSSLRATVSRNRKIGSIPLSGNNIFEYRCIRIIIIHIQQLQVVLLVFFLQLITDGAIKNLAFCCRMLTWLNLAGCKLVHMFHMFGKFSLFKMDK